MGRFIAESNLKGVAILYRQDDSSFPPALVKFGCYYTSILWHAEQLRCKMISRDEYLDIYRAAMMTGIISKEKVENGVLVDGCTVLDPLALFDLAGYSKFRSVSKSPPGELPPPKGIEILVFHRDADFPKGMGNKPHTHFVAGNGKGQVAFDPLGQSNTVKHGFLQSKRIFS